MAQVRTFPANGNLPVYHSSDDPTSVDPDRTLGIEVTDPRFSSRCGLGNVDPQHGPDAGPDAPAAVEVAVDLPLPPPGTILLTLRPDMDSLGAMAVLLHRAKGGVMSSAMLDRIRRIAVVDRFEFGAWPGIRALPVSVADLTEDGIGAELSAIAACAADRGDVLCAATGVGIDG